MNTAAVLDRGTALGYVEARTADRILGWAWDPAAPESRLTVVLLDGATVLAETLADQPREDLARNGVGDGAHAFAFLLPEAWRGRAASLAVAVRGADGRLAPLAAPPAAAPADQASLSRLVRGVEQLAASQRTMLRALRAPATPDADHDDRLAEIAAAQERIERSVAALEVFVLRLDERLAALAERGSPPRASRSALGVAAIFGLLAAGALAAALAPVFGIQFSLPFEMPFRLPFGVPG